jgi:hypothetical protein
MYFRSFRGSVLVSGVLAVAGCSSNGDPSGTGGSPGGGAATVGGQSGSSTGGETTAGSGGGNDGPGGKGNAGSAAGGSGAGGSQSSAGEGGSSAGGGGGEPDEFGFSYRVPGDKNLDWLCTFNDAAASGYVYVRLLQTGTTSTGLATVPVYSAELAQISIDGQLAELSGATYDYGGGHHNDSLAFEYAGKSQRYYHSSFGFGFRSCQNMDCRNVHAPGTTAIETEGCGSDRALPEVCVSFEADGTHEPLADRFMKCPGDMQ